MTSPSRAERKRRRLESTAYHEAGHAVACIELGRPFDDVTIVPEGDAAGHLLKKLAPGSIRPDIDLSSKATQWIEREVLIMLAGLAAEHRFAGRHNWHGAGNDMHQAVDLASFVYFESKLLSKYLDFMVERTKQFIGSPLVWIRVEAIAAALMVHSTLSARRARQIAREVLMDPASRARINELFARAKDDRKD